MQKRGFGGRATVSLHQRSSKIGLCAGALYLMTASGRDALDHVDNAVNTGSVIDGHGSVIQPTWAERVVRRHSRGAHTPRRAGGAAEHRCAGSSWGALRGPATDPWPPPCRV